MHPRNHAPPTVAPLIEEAIEMPDVLSDDEPDLFDDATTKFLRTLLEGEPARKERT